MGYEIGLAIVAFFLGVLNIRKGFLAARISKSENPNPIVTDVFSELVVSDELNLIRYKEVLTQIRILIEKQKPLTKKHLTAIMEVAKDCRRHLVLASHWKLDEDLFYLHKASEGILRRFFIQRIYSVDLTVEDVNFLENILKYCDDLKWLHAGFLAYQEKRNILPTVLVQEVRPYLSKRYEKEGKISPESMKNNKQAGYAAKEIFIYIVPGAIALMLVFLFTYLVVTNSENPDYSIPEVLTNLLTMIVGYFFGAAAAS
ncbi:MAG: hypothetical protein R3F50_16575 [Gammaproteobacteria bacterium]